MFIKYVLVVDSEISNEHSCIHTWSSEPTVITKRLCGFPDKGTKNYLSERYEREWSRFSLGWYRIGEGVGIHPLLNSEELHQAVKAEQERLDNNYKRPVIVAQGCMGSSQDQSLDDFLAELEERRKLRKEQDRQHPYRTAVVNAYHAVRRFWRDTANPEQVAREAKFAWQRATRGWSDRDTWGMDYYLSRVIPDMVAFLRTSKDGLPTKLPDDWTPENWRDYLLEGNNFCHYTEQEFDDILSRIEIGFRRYAERYHNAPFSDSELTDEEKKFIDDEFAKSGQMLLRYFHLLWS